MFKKLFGSSKPTKAQAQPQMDPQQTMEKLSEQIDIVEKRAKKIDADMKRHLSDALAKKKAGDQRGKLSDSLRFKVLFSSLSERRCLRRKSQNLRARWSSWSSSA